MNSFDKTLEDAYLNELMDGLNDTDSDVLMYELMDSVAVTADGCIVEPDGKCEHGYSSPQLLLGII